MIALWSFITEHILLVLLILNYVFAAGIGLLILSENRNPSKTAAYLLMLIFLPGISILIYVFLGQNYRKKRIFNRKRAREIHSFNDWSEGLIDYIQEENITISGSLQDKIKLAKMLVNYHGKKAFPTIYNEIKILNNGEEKFPALLEAMENAQHHIHLEYYIIDEGETWNKLQEVLLKKAKEGIQVRIIYDDIGSGLKSATLKKLRLYGIEIFPFMPVYISRLADKANYRDHRKIAIIDGKIGFTGGINLADEYWNNGRQKLYWRDVHIRISGEAVLSLQLYFLLNWNFVSKQKIHPDALLMPAFKVESTSVIQFTGSGPDSAMPSIFHAYTMAIYSAKKNIHIVNPYFVPPDTLLTALQTAAIGGVKVRLLLPKSSDSQIVQYATLSYIEPLLRAGAEIYLYKKGFIHSKWMSIDDDFCTVGSCNLDSRSFNINYEINAIIYDPEITRQFNADFEKDITDAEKISLSSWSKRGRWQKYKESFCRIAAPVI